MLAMFFFLTDWLLMFTQFALMEAKKEKERLEQLKREAEEKE